MQQLWIKYYYVIDYVPAEKVNGEAHDPLGFIYIAAWRPIKGGIVNNNLCYQLAVISAPFFRVSIVSRLLESLPEYPKIIDFSTDNNLYYTTGVP